MSSDGSSDRTAGHPRADLLIAYAFAFLVGLAFALWTTPMGLLAGRDGPSAFVQEDVATYIAAQRYYLSDGWHWPVLRTVLMAPPQGVNIAFADAIPIAALASKISGLHPPDVQVVSAWLLVLRVLQPLAATAASHAFGVRRFTPLASTAVIAVSVPVWQVQSIHVGLDSHFLLLGALALYALMVRAPDRRPAWAAGALMVLTLLVHVYLLLMVAAVLMAAPMTLGLRGDRAWRRVFVEILAGCAVTVAVALVLGYGGFGETNGFGTFSMNLLSPFDLSRSSLLPHLLGPVNATGGQTEGYQYLGLGLWLLTGVAAVILCVKPDYGARHAGLIIVCVSLTFLALSNHIYLGNKLLVSFPAPHFLDQVRASGRFFWPVTYLLCVAGPALVCRAAPSWCCAVLPPVLALVQFADIAGYQADLHFIARTTRPWSIDAPTLRPLFAQASDLDLWPEQWCGGTNDETYMEVLLLASERALPFDTTPYLARPPRHFQCAREGQALAPLRPREVRVFLPQAPVTEIASVPEANDLCRHVRQLVVCMRSLRTSPLPGLGLGPGPALSTAAATPAPASGSTRDASRR